MGCSYERNERDVTGEQMAGDTGALLAAGQVSTGSSFILKQFQSIGGFLKISENSIEKAHKNSSAFSTYNKHFT